MPGTMDYSPSNSHLPSASSPPGRASSSARGPLAGGRQITRNRASYSCHGCRRRKVKCDKVSSPILSDANCARQSLTLLFLQAHPVCGNCAKTGAECVYDALPQQREDAGDGPARSGLGVKRRRETPQSLEDDVDELQSIYGHLQKARSSPDQKSDPRAIEARLDKLLSMIERLGGTSQALEAAGKHSAAATAGLESALIEELRQSSARNGRSASSRPASPRRAAAESSGDEFPIPSGQATDLVDPIGSLNLGHLSLEDGGRSR